MAGGENAAGRPSMPFKSQAQRRKFAQLLVEGKISAQTFEEWNRETGGAKLPEHVSDTTKKGGRQAARKKGAGRKKGARKKAAGKGSSRKRTTRRGGAG
jgi:hypothetical protein